MNNPPRTAPAQWLADIKDKPPPVSGSSRDLVPPAGAHRCLGTTESRYRCSTTSASHGLRTFSAARPPAYLYTGTVNSW